MKLQMCSLRYITVHEVRRTIKVIKYDNSIQCNCGNNAILVDVDVMKDVKDTDMYDDIRCSSSLYPGFRGNDLI